MTLDPDRALPGTLVVVAPHMDDELIGCGAILASLRDPARAHVIYASDGSGSPAPPVPWHRVDRAELARVRREEGCAGLEALGIPRENARFLDLPDGGLRRHREALEARLSEALAVLGPDIVLVPFRLDRHPDHLAVHRAVRRLAECEQITGRLMEYFVYARWKLLPGGDIRRRIRPGLLLAFDPGPEAQARKQRALRRHRTQTTRYFPWQKRANLTSEFMERVGSETEYLLASDRRAAAEPGTGGGDVGAGVRSIFPIRGGDRPADDEVFTGSTFWIRVVHLLEPPLKRGKDRLVALVRR